ncbi:hypothetical protein M7775_02325 [Sporomusa sphaeroides DSM 2875]|uniref:hypothetical protein n=1 Tax=Sporomusa sphaeroides TaxID=47679 RepID=UPI00202E6AF9|nr:hypothetical protein [Sporomusa sphaeroides]MCM0757402.1 hypothetical protein [Sporomusa sphaeroides DSM 2875]
MLRRKQLHKLIDQLPDSVLDDVRAMLQDYIQYNAAIPRMDGLPVYHTGNPEHTKIIMDRHGSENNKKYLKVAKEVNSID